MKYIKVLLKDDVGWFNDLRYSVTRRIYLVHLWSLSFVWSGFIFKWKLHTRYCHDSSILLLSILYKSLVKHGTGAGVIVLCFYILFSITIAIHSLHASNTVSTTGHPLSHCLNFIREWLNEKFVIMYKSAINE